MRRILPTSTKSVLFSKLRDAFQTHRNLLATALAAAFFLFLAGAGNAQAQTATVNWTDVHQVIDGFGGIDRDDLSSSQQSFVFGTGSGQLGISILHTNVPGDPADCTSVGTGCVTVSSNMQAVLANGGKVWIDGTTPPSRYLESYTLSGCSNAGNRVIPGDFGAWATWIANYVKSLQAQGVNISGVSIDNEPDTCGFTYLSPQDFDTFISQNLGPTFASQGISSLIYLPEVAGYDDLTAYANTCMSDSTCKGYVGGIAFHDYDLSMSGFSVSATPYPFGTQGGIKYWETEFGMYQCGGYQAFCEQGWNTDMTTDGLQWAAILDQRMAVDNLNAWQIYLLQTYDNNDDGLISGNTGSIAKRAYVMGHYSRFVRPGYFRIDATHNPVSGVTVSAYQNTSSNTLVIIATNYTGSAVSQTFNLTNAPSFSTLTPTITSASLSLAAQSNVSVSGGSFTYTLPAQSITTFVATAGVGPQPPSNLSGAVVQ
jgi:glucuronoarabinoxylan endo-1,4-beta-xylanase